MTNQVDPLKIVEEVASDLALAASFAQNIPAAAPYAVIIGGLARLAASVARAIEAKDGAQLAAVDAQLQAALAGLPAELAANDAAVDAKLAAEKK